MTDVLKFVGGDEVIEPFLIEDSDGNILDLADMTVTGSVRWRDLSRIALGVGTGIEIINNRPDRSSDPSTQEPHGFFTLSELQTISIPFGQVSSLRIKAVSSGVVTMSSFLVAMERIS
jgi:hypothetical protein